jgi:prepilin-type N-terminal cleavage/methylation domain-containing protein
MTLQTRQSGYSLVEVLIAVSVLLISMVGPMTIASQGIKSGNFALEQNAAFFLAQEGIEAMYSLYGDAGVADIDNDLTPGTDTSWDWVGALNSSGPCSTNFNSDGDSCTFGIDFRDTSLNDNLTSNECTGGNLSQCDLYLNESNSPAAYSHQSSGADPTPFNRTITVTRQTDNAVEVVSIVTWESNVFRGQTQSVRLQTLLFDVPYES